MAKSAKKARRGAAGKSSKTKASAKKSVKKISAKKLALKKRLLRVYSLLTANTPDTIVEANRQLDEMIAAGTDPIHDPAEKAYALVDAWRNGVDLPADVTKCNNDYGTPDLLECAVKYAQNSIDAAAAAGKPSPYGYWAMAYALKYQRQPQLSAFYYQSAHAKADGGFDTPRDRKHLMCEWVESQIYWLEQKDLGNLVSIINLNTPSNNNRRWMNWIKCFAWHMMKDYTSINTINAGHLPQDADFDLIRAANFARQNDQANRALARNSFRAKPGNANWNAAMELSRSPFVSAQSADWWRESVTLALA